MKLKLGEHRFSVPDLVSSFPRVFEPKLCVMYSTDLKSSSDEGSFSD